MANQPHIDGLRALAVLAVLGFHLGVPGCSGGFVGVDVFLVISGFLITRVIRNEIDQTGKFEFGKFYLRRIRRLAPALVMTVSLTAIGVTILFSTDMLIRFGSELLSCVLSTSNIYYWTEANYFDTAAKLKPLLHTWSLSLEEQFYLIWPATFVLLYRRRLRKYAPWVIICVGLVSLWLNFPYGRGGGASPESMRDYFVNGKSTIYFLLPFRVFEFGIGALLVWLERRRWKQVLFDDLALVLGMSLVGFSIIRFNEELLFPYFWALIPCLGAALAIHAGERSRLSIFLKNRIFVGIGLISYSLYLLHWPLIVFYSYAIGPLGIWSSVSLTVCSVLFGYLSWRFIELPFRTQRWKLRIIIFPAACAIACGIAMRLGDGWTWRLDPQYSVQLSGDSKQFHIRCYGGEGFTTRTTPNDREPDVLLVGDSLAMHLAEGLQRELIEPSGLAMYINAGSSCFHLPGFTRTTAGVDWDVLAKENVTNVVNTVRHLKKKPIVILAHFWTAQMRLGALLTDTGAHIDRALEVEDIINGILRLKEEAGIEQLVVVGQIPGTRYHLYDEITKPRLARWLSGTSSDRLRKSPQFPDRQEFNAALREAASRTGGFIFLDPCDLLCDSVGCNNFTQDGHPVYTDLIHLSKYGSRDVIRGFLNQLYEALEARTVGN